MKLHRIALLVGLGLLTTGCGRHIYHVAGCDERLSIPHKRVECRACVERPIPHEFLPDMPDGERCVRR